MVRFSWILTWLIVAMTSTVGVRSAWCQEESPASTKPVAGSQQDELWEYSPYRVRVWFALGRDPRLTGQLLADLQAYFARQADVVAPATWILTSREAPEDMRSEMLDHMERITFESILKRHPTEVDDRQITKLLMISARQDAEGITLQTREVDCRTRRLGGVFSTQINHPALVCKEAFRLARSTFSPVARVVRAKGRQAKLRLRAGGLVVLEEDPARLDADRFLLPVVRNNDRYGNPREGGILVPPWTFLQVLSRKRGDLECRVHSGMSNPVGGRNSARKERLALAVSPSHTSTQLKVLTRTKPKRPLAGFDIYAKNPVTDKAELIGRTDWRGVFEVKQEGPLMRIVYVRSGDALLARLPMVPGLDAELVAETVDDSIRLRAEGFVKNMQSELLDLVARRMLTARRIQKRLESGKVEEAQELFDQYKLLPNAKTLSTRLRANRVVNADADDRTRRKMDRMYTDLDKLITKFLSTELQDSLEKELAAARQSAARTSDSSPGS